MTKPRNRRRGKPTVAGGELVFVVDVTYFTEQGFVGSSNYEGREVDLEFDPAGNGVSLPHDMAERLGATNGGTVTVIVEDGAATFSNARVSVKGRKVRISDPKVYAAIGSEGGGVVRVRAV